MTPFPKSEPPGKSEAPPAKRPKRPGAGGPKVEGGTAEARRVAAVILDVLAGVRTPSQAAEAVGLSPARYYSLESRALEGMVQACEPRPKGRAVSPERESSSLKKRVEFLERELARKQAQLRATQRAIGLAQPAAPDPKAKRKRRPVVRALKAAAVLRSEPEPREVKPEEKVVS